MVGLELAFFSFNEGCKYASEIILNPYVLNHGDTCLLIYPASRFHNDSMVEKLAFLADFRAEQ